MLAAGLPLSAQPNQTLREGCAPNTFQNAAPAGWFAATMPDPPDRKEGCVYILYAENKSPAAVVQIESAPADLALFRDADPFEILPDRIAAGLRENMNVAITRETYRNEDVKRAPQSAITRASMHVFDAQIVGNSMPQEAVIVLARSAGHIFTIVVVAPHATADAKRSAAARQALQTVLNSLAPRRE